MFATAVTTDTEASAATGGMGEAVQETKGAHF